MWFDWESDASSAEGRKKLSLEITEVLTEAVGDETEADET
jgi:hypothetical protein